MLGYTPFKCIINDCYGNIDGCGHHLLSRGAGGSDYAHNLLPLCRNHHGEIHKIGRSTFIEKYPDVKTWMLSNRWQKCEITNKWFRISKPLDSE